MNATEIQLSLKEFGFGKPDLILNELWSISRSDRRNASRSQTSIISW